jgi:hypothetical protein
VGIQTSAFSLGKSLNASVDREASWIFLCSCFVAAPLAQSFDIKILTKMISKLLTYIRKNIARNLTWDIDNFMNLMEARSTHRVKTSTSRICDASFGDEGGSSDLQDVAVHSKIKSVLTSII